MLRSLMLFVIIVFLVGLLPQLAFAEDDLEGPDCFDALLLATLQYGDDPDDGELRDLWISYINETDPDFFTEEAVYLPLIWDWPEFNAVTEYVAENEYGEWEAYYELYGMMDEERLKVIDGVELPYIDFVVVAATVEWWGEDGSSYVDAWTYTLNDIPPVLKPKSDYFVDQLPNGLLADRLCYSLHSNGKPKALKRLEDFYSGTSSSDPAFPDSDYSDEVDIDAVVDFEFDLVMYYYEDI